MDWSQNTNGACPILTGPWVACSFMFSHVRASMIWTSLVEGETFLPLSFTVALLEFHRLDRILANFRTL